MKSQSVSDGVAGGGKLMLVAEIPLFLFATPVLTSDRLSNIFDGRYSLSYLGLTPELAAVF